ncbi:S-adenosyl-L-methionine-dependent methyltransferase [Macrolepiota fuliginosa MF-IS2]|uniref:S-adenosyl-L-methionine-dependent methyltransferase n=1 Tax=Macrolepiota fuliginosa MF-IS2 TaxID=1400762 RepID=A0A9P6C5N1_9AGAR|nr:S-adenosyl-L-methionine-dependent methyltransferase [Macrolepiota fuliginosa MF-IS2]
MTLSLETQTSVHVVSPQSMEGETNACFVTSDEGERERERTLQHNLLLKATRERQIHIPIKLDEGGAILESGTGSGIWLLDLAKTIPDTSEIIGIDIAPNLFPQPSTLPLNVKFHVQSVLTLSPEWTNKFDFVHQRLLVLGLREAEWKIALSEIYRVLKPGGWVQLVEINNSEESGPMLAMFSKWQKYVKEAGFSDIRLTWHYSPAGKWAGQEGLKGKKNILEFMRAVREQMVKARLEFGFAAGESGFDKLIEDVEQEFDSHYETRTRYVMICGRKPIH